MKHRPNFKIRARLLNLLLLACWCAAPACRKEPTVEIDSPAASPPDATSASTNNTLHAWRHFRGSDQGRASPELRLPLLWSETTNLVWKTAILGTGASSPVLSEDKVWLTTAMDEGRSLCAVALDPRSGALLFQQEIFNLAAAPPQHRVNNPASPTPVLDHDKLFVSFGTHGVACLSAADGSVLWRNTDLQFDTEKMGPGASPILAGDILALSCDGTDQRFIAGLNKDTGEVLWKTDRSNRIATAIPYRKAFSTPLLAELNGVEQIISSSSYRLFGYNPQSGQELWSVEIPGFCPIPVPSVRGNMIYVCTGYNKAELWAFEAQQAGKSPKRLWKSSRSVPHISSPVLVQDYLYFVSQDGIASCVEAASGDLQWNERLGGAFWASPLAADGRIYFFAENGVTTVLAAAPEFRVLAKNSLAGEIMATPACFEDAFFLRTKTHLYRLQSHPAQPSPAPSVSRSLTSQSTPGKEVEK